MPYGIAKKVGGDTKSADAWMENCISSVMKKGTPKLSAILICKSQYQKTKGGKS